MSTSFIQWEEYNGGCFESQSCLKKKLNQERNSYPIQFGVFGSFLVFFGLIDGFF